MSTFMKRDRFPQVVLPYIELESIQSTGTQYIDTGFMPNQDTRVVMDAMLISKTTHAMYFGAKGDSGQTKEYMLLSLSSTDLNIRSDYYGTRITQSLNTIGVRVNIDKNKNVCIVNGVVMTNTYNTGISDYPLYLLAANYYGTAQYIMTGKVYSCQIYDNGILVRDFIPVQLKNTKEVGLWDKVEGVFYSNAGTGEFIAGEVAA